MDSYESLAFVAGATGYTGREVVSQLRERGVPTVAHVRPDSSRLKEWRDRFESQGARVDTTAWEKEAMGATLKRLAPVSVFALLGTVQARMARARKEGRDPQSESYEAVDYGLTVLLLDAAKACGSSPRFIYLSAVGVKENSKSAYYQARARVERRLLGSGLPYCVARPSFITGPDRDDGRPLERLGAAASDGLLRFAGLFGGGRLRERYASITNTCLAGALVKIALDPDAENKIFDPGDLRKLCSAC